MIKSVIKQLARKLGYTLIPDWGFKEFPLEHYLSLLFANRNIDLVLDVGANEGQYGCMLRHALGYRGRILSFEPNPAAFARLRETIGGDPNWQAFNIGLGETPGMLKLNVTANSVFSSFLEPQEDEAVYMIGNRTERTVDVPVERLDTFLPTAEGSAARNIYLKMDTQGFDLAVFAGSAGMRDRIEALQSELSMIQIYKGMPSYKEAMDVFTAAGYSVSGMFPVSWAADMRMIEFDGVFCRQGKS
jgi:FkbM family methyltransferase